MFCDTGNEHPKTYAHIAYMEMIYKVRINTVVDWSTTDVMNFLGKDVNPLYNDGFKRVGCFPCFACATPKQLQKAYSYDEFGASQLAKVQAMEIELGVKHKHSKTEQVCSWCEI